jgi:very-short-patch-repair endonuclease
MYDYTNIEQILFNELTKRNIHFVTQFPTESGFVLDFVIPPNIVIETDGPCHNSRKARKRDWFRDKVLKTEGWKVYRITYKIIKDTELFRNYIDNILLSI